MGESPIEYQMKLVKDYSLGLLSADQERVLLATARGNPELEDMLRRQCPQYDRSMLFPTPETKQTEIVVPLPRRRKQRAWLVAPAVAASLALMFWFGPRQGDELYWLPVDEAMTLQRSGYEADDHLSQGLVLYATGDLIEAVAALQKAEVQGAVEDLRNLYLASALINVGQTEDAHEILLNMDLDLLPHPWRDYGIKLETLSRSFQPG